jgi:hypothetical protein
MATIDLPQNAGIAGVANSRRDAFVAPPMVLTGSFPVETEIEQLVTQAADLEAYTLVARNDSTGNITVCNPSASDGTQKPIGFLASKALQSANTESVSVVKTGVFNPNVVIFDDSTGGFADIAAVKAALRERAPCLFLREPVTGS